MTVSLRTYADQIREIEPTVPFSSTEHSFLPHTNEMGEEGTFAALERLPKEGNVFIGVSGYFSLKLALKREDEYILLLDCSSRVAKFWNAFFSIVENSTNQEDCVKAIQNEFQKNISTYTDFRSVHLSVESYNAYFRLFTKELFDVVPHAYEKIKDLLQTGKLVFLRVDLIDEKACKAIQAVHTTFSMRVDVAYLSNVLNFITLKEMLPYCKSLLSLLSKNTVVIDIEPSPYKITAQYSSLLSKFNPGLHDYLCAVSNFTQTPPELKQRVRQITDPSYIAKLYPLMALAIITPKYAFYLNGLIEEFYAAEEVDTAEKILTNKLPKTMPPNCNKKALRVFFEMITLDALYKKQTNK